MIKVYKLTFNPFQENTYILAAGDNSCAIVDPGCYSMAEKQELSEFIARKNLLPKWLINTHFHLDHVFGNKYVAEKWHLPLSGHKNGAYTLSMNRQAAEMYGIRDLEPSPEIDVFLTDGDTIKMGDDTLNVFYVPGHSKGHIALVSYPDKFVIAGDVLFQGSIGRTDLPGGNFDTLETSIREKLYSLPDDFTVFCGHGPETTIGNEKYANPFVRE